MEDNIMVTVGANIKDFSKRMNEAGKTLKNFASANKETFDAFKSTGKVVTGAGVALAGGLGVAVKLTADFESGMSRVAALSGATDDEMRNLTATARQLGKDTAFSAKQASEGMSELALSGFKTNEIIDAMPGLLDLAAAGQTDLGLTAGITSNMLNAFGLDAKESTRVADVMSYAFTNSATDLAGLGETMKYAAPVAKAMGLSIEEVSAAAGILGNAGIVGSQAGTTLSMALTKLASPSTEAAKLMKKLGFNAFDSNGKMKSLSEVISGLEKSTADLTDEQKLGAVSTLFGAQASKSMLTLMDAGGGTIRDFTKELEGAGGTAKDIAAKQLENLSGQLTILSSGLQELAISIGTALLPYLKVAAEFVQSLVDRFNGLSEPMKSTIAIVAGVTSVFLLLLGPFLMLIGFIPNIIAGFIAVKTVFLALTGPIGLTVAAIAGVIAILILAYNKIEWFRDLVDDAWEWMKENTMLAFNAIKDVVMSIINEVSTFINEQLAKVKAIWDKHGEAIMTIIKVAFSNVWERIKMVMGIIKGLFEVVWPIISGVIKVAWGIIKTTIRNTMDIILGIIDTVMSLIKGDWEGAWESIKGTAENIVDNLIRFFEDIDLVQIGKDIIQGLIKGVGSMATAVGRAAKNIASNIKNSITDFLGIKSPSRVMMSVGFDTGEGLAIGIRDMRKMVEKETQGLAEATIVKPDLSYSTPNASYRSMSGAINGSIDVRTSSTDSLLSEIARELRARRNMIVEMDGRAVGQMVAPTVSREIDRETDIARRSGGY